MSAPSRKRQLLAALTTGFLAVSGLVALPALAAPTSATLVGSFQTELGCDADWKPECQATEMSAGDDGVYQLTATVPAGDWEFKVALNKSFDESYGDGGKNIPLTLAGPTELTFTYHSETHAIGIRPTTLPGGYSDADAGLVAKPATHDGAGQQFYFVLTDRFENGNTDNDTAELGNDRLTSGFDPSDVGFYHGGDLAGLTKKLDYIQGLGTTAIWLTPSLKNNPVQGEGKDASAGYHGYWITDFTQIDPHLGSNEDMKAFIDAAHKRGIKVYFDIITNHTADLIDYKEGAYDYRDIASHPYKDKNGNVVDVRKLAGKQGFPEFDPATSFPYTPVREDKNAIMVPEWLNDVTLYHNRGNSTWEGESVTFGDFVGLDDLMTENPKVVDGMAEIYKSWMDLGIDGFRIDTVKHVNFEFWTSFSKQLQDHAKATNPKFFTFGEVYDADAAKISPYMRKTDMSAVLDFAFQSRAVNFAKGLTTQGLSSLFADDDRYTTPHSDASFLPTFLGNHDMGRVGHFLSGSSDPVKRSELAHSLMYLTRGQPVVYYGDEQGFAGDGGDKAARQSMFASKAKSYTDQKLLDGSPFGTGDHFNTSATLYERIAALGKLRKDHAALNTGAQIELFAADGPGIYAFARVDRDEKREYVVALNNTGEAKTQEISTLTPGSSYAPLHGATEAITANADGKVSVTVPPLSAVVYRADDTLAAAPLKPTLTLAGGALDAMAPVAVDTTDSRWAETSFSYRVSGTKDYTPLGVATGPDGRVFHDTTALKRGTLVEYRAVTTDAAGNREATSGFGVVGVDLSGTANEGGGGDNLLVTVPGSHNAAMGCPGDWQPDCQAAKLTKDANSSWYTGTFDIPAGDYKFKIAIGGSWDENYGAGGVPGGPDMGYTSPDGKVTFYYDPVTHRAFTSVDGPVVTLPGSFNKALGCTGGDGGNWDPACLATLMTPGEGDTYTFTTDKIPTGSHEVKVAHGLSWDENYGADGKRDGDNISFTAQEGKNVTFTYDVATHILSIEVSDPPVAGSGEQRAYWIDATTIALPKALFGSTPAPDAKVTLGYNPTGGLALADGAITGEDAKTTPLAYVGDLTKEQLARFPHLKDTVAFSVTGLDRAAIEDVLTGAIQVLIAREAPIAFTGVQIPGVLDDLFAKDARANGVGVTFDGDTPTLRLWAPTAKSVALQLWDNATGEGDPQTVEMTRGTDGTWQVEGQADWKNRAYRFAVEVYVPRLDEVTTNAVTDPYSLTLTPGSTHSVLIDLKDPALAPKSWQDTPVPVVKRPVDQMIYELHVRDFSILDSSVPKDLRGTYKAFTLKNSDGMKHLAELAEAGVNTVHLLPTFDIASIPEPRSEQVTPEIPDAGPASEEQQAAITAVAGKDGFNWGYDPYHFFAPEGSYASAESATGRVAEFREMVAALNGTGLRVVADQVFNHTAASGQDDESVLDKVVPGYYHRLNAAGKVETSTCCQNIATEHQMAEQLMVDSVVTWARDYHVSGFRFDLMGHHSVGNMTAVKKALEQLTVENDGIDGSTIHLYGEGWDFGEVNGNARFTQAKQGQLSNTQIATFSDRLRDAVHGGSPVDGDSYRDQGFGTGLFTDPNGKGRLQGDEAGLADLKHQTDLVRLGLAGNLADYQLLAADGKVKPGKEFDYRGAPAGYAAQPDEVISYVDAHDNETLFDLSVIKLPEKTSMADRIRMNTVQLSTVALAQTPAFWHAGTDLLRSKSLDRDSYNSGDHFNAIDWRGIDHNFGVGLPPKEKNGEKWDQMRPLLEDPAKKATADELQLAHKMALDLVRVRYESPLIRLGSAEAISQKVTFPGAGPDQTPGLVVMHIDDTKGSDTDPARDGALVVINASPKEITQQVDGLDGKDFALSPVLAGGADDVVKQTAWDKSKGTVTIPARTTAVLYQAQTGEPSPTAEPTADPTATPTGDPTGGPTGDPTGGPTEQPTASPSGPGKPPMPITGSSGMVLALLALLGLVAGGTLVGRRGRLISNM
ncbi:alpha-1,6-glucosidase [Bowdeniella nasicola]|uniref:Alpha-1,6-glucosidase n=1 Tax=Bowdeniella nasicola TaxID=208480 RepID=A0A1Q5Q1L1_9ACTO|nr:pullulanase-type alpha-1,6-glucosidase [Bowdeniella nasicola]OKL53731.1 alpha-1,6-glucosidase [Bowdeniella nasicola]